VGLITKINNELVALLCVRLYSSHSSDSHQETSEQIFIEFDIDDFHQHFPAYSKVYAGYPNIWPLGVSITATYLASSKFQFHTQSTCGESRWKETWQKCE